MTPAIVGIAVAAALVSAANQAPTESPKTAEATASPGQRVESDSYTYPREIARCIAYNINRKMPELRVRNNALDSPDEGGYLILTTGDAEPETFGVIRVARAESGSHLTTWLPHGSPSNDPQDIARRLIAGC